MLSFPTIPPFCRLSLFIFYLLPPFQVHFRIWFSRSGGVGWMIGLGDLRGLVQPMILWFDFEIIYAITSQLPHLKAWTRYLPDPLPQPPWEAHSPSDSPAGHHPSAAPAHLHITGNSVTSQWLTRKQWLSELAVTLVTQQSPKEITAFLVCSCGCVF